MSRGDPERREKFIAARVDGKSMAEAARAASYPRAYVYTLVKRYPEVQAEIDRRLGELPEGPDRQKILHETIERLEEIRDDPDAGSTAQVSAARALMSWATGKGKAKPGPSAASAPEVKKPTIKLLDPNDRAAQDEAARRLAL